MAMPVKGSRFMVKAITVNGDAGSGFMVHGERRMVDEQRFLLK